MKRLIGFALIGSAFAAVPAHALTVTTSFQQFNWYPTNAGGSTGTSTPAFLTFPNFSSFSIPNATLNNVWFKLAADSFGNGNASVTGRARLNNSDGTDDAKLSQIGYRLGIIFPNAISLTDTEQFSSSVSCVTESADCSTVAGVVTVPAGTSGNSTNIQTSGSYTGSGNSFGIQNNAQLNFFTNGTVTTTSYGATYSSNAYNVNDPQAAFVNFSIVTPTTARINMSGYVALVYDYSLPGAQVPGPIAITGTLAAFGWSRKLRQRTMQRV